MLTEADKRVVRAFVNERAADSRLLETDGVSLEKIGLGGETVAVWRDGRIAIISTESAKSDESIIRLISKEAGPGVVDFSYPRKGHRQHTLGAPGRLPSVGRSDHSRNGRTSTVDEVALRELDLYIANTYELVGAPNSIGKSIDVNLRRKLEKGTYDSALAPKAWLHLADEGAKRYTREFGSDSPIFNAATRRALAESLARAWEEENGAGMRRNASPEKRLITDTSMIGLFKHGFDRALDLWRSGYTAESITHLAQSGSSQDRGMVAACEMILGWHDIAEREARAHGMTRDEASRFVAEKNEQVRRTMNANGAAVEDPKDLARWAVRDSLERTESFGVGPDHSPRACVIGRKDQRRAGGRHAVLQALRNLPGLLDETEDRDGYTEFVGGAGPTGVWRIVVVGE